MNGCYAKPAETVPLLYPLCDPSSYFRTRQDGDSTWGCPLVYEAILSAKAKPELKLLYYTVVPWTEIRSQYENQTIPYSLQPSPVALHSSLTLPPSFYMSRASSRTRSSSLLIETMYLSFGSLFCLSYHIHRLAMLIKSSSVGNKNLWSGNPIPIWVYRPPPILY